MKVAASKSCLVQSKHVHVGLCFSILYNTGKRKRYGKLRVGKAKCKDTVRQKCHLHLK